VFPKAALGKTNHPSEAKRFLFLLLCPVTFLLIPKRFGLMGILPITYRCFYGPCPFLLPIRSPRLPFCWLPRPEFPTVTLGSGSALALAALLPPLASVAAAVVTSFCHLGLRSWSCLLLRNYGPLGRTLRDPTPLQSVGADTPPPPPSHGSGSGRGRVRLPPLRGLSDGPIGRSPRLPFCWLPRPEFPTVTLGSGSALALAALLPPLARAPPPCWSGSLPSLGVL
jgi:hypothetical protein